MPPSLKVPPGLATGSSGTFTANGQILATNGTAALPAYSFASDPDTGFSRSSGNRIGISSAGVDFTTLENGYVRVVSGTQFAFSSSASDSGVAADAAMGRADAAVVKVTNGSTGIGALLSSRLVEANTAVAASPNILTATESGTALTNEGIAAQNYHALPTAVAGLTFTFIVQDADGIRVVANTGDTIRVAGTASAAAGYIQNSTIGSAVTLLAINATEWFAISTVGTWTVDS